MTSKTMQWYWKSRKCQGRKEFQKKKNSSKMLLVHDYFYAAQIILEFYCNSAAFQFLGLLFIRFAVYCLNFWFHTPCFLSLIERTYQRRVHTYQTRVFKIYTYKVVFFLQIFVHVIHSMTRTVWCEAVHNFLMWNL